jgi:hypothetical protein
MKSLKAPAAPQFGNFLSRGERPKLKQPVAPAAREAFLTEKGRGKESIFGQQFQRTAAAIEQIVTFGCK